MRRFLGPSSQSRPASKFEARKMEIWPWLNFYKFGTQIFSDEKLRRHRCICGDLRRLWSTNGAGAQTSLRRWGVKDEWAWTSGFGWRDKILQILSLRFRWRKQSFGGTKTIEFWFWDPGGEDWKAFTFMQRVLLPTYIIIIISSSFSSVLFICCVSCVRCVSCPEWH